jgi:hypothetical protein
LGLTVAHEPTLIAREARARRRSLRPIVNKQVIEVSA